MSFLLRVVLPDKPGSLGAVATALGNAGADILGVDVVERADGHAIDDLAVELPPGRPPDVLITAAESVPGVEVESVRPDSRTPRHRPRAWPDRGDHQRPQGGPRTPRRGRAADLPGRLGDRRRPREHPGLPAGPERGCAGDGGRGPAMAAAGAHRGDRSRCAVGARPVDGAGHRAGRRPPRPRAAGAGRRPPGRPAPSARPSWPASPTSAGSSRRFSPRDRAADTHGPSLGAGARLGRPRAACRAPRCDRGDHRGGAGRGAGVRAAAGGPVRAADHRGRVRGAQPVRRPARRRRLPR